MEGRQSAFEALGLRPGADRAQIEEAYRRLIKRYHPDRPGGDGGRAAEITRAYRELRDGQHTLPVRMTPPAARVRAQQSRHLGTIVTAFVVIAAAAVIVRYFDIAARSDSASAGVAPLVAAGKAEASTAMPASLDDFQEPLSSAAIDHSAADALRIYKGGNPARLADYSRACQSQFRNHPDIAWFDACAAFDEAVVLLQSRDPIADSGPFNSAAVTGREMGAAGLLSDDSFAADSRLRKIRSRVELALLAATSR
jgi:hypothetical protein